MKHRGRICHVVLVTALFVSSLMFATAAPAADQNPCSEDIAKFCKDIEPGQRALMECLEQHEAQLSNACRDYEAKIEKTRMESRERTMQQRRVRQACRGEVAKFCGDMKLGGGGLTACLSGHGSELSAPCRDAVEAARAEDEKTTK